MPLWQTRLPLNPLDRRPPPRDGFPTAPGRFPKIGHLPAMMWSLPKLCEWVSDTFEGPVWLDRGFGSHVLQITGDLGFELLRNKDTNSSALHDVAPTFLGRSMIVMDGADHRRARGASAHAFSPSGLSGARVGRLIADAVEERVSGWTSGTLEVAREARELALTIIFTMIGIDVADIPAWRHNFEELALSAVNVPFDFPGSPMRRGKNALRWLDERMGTIIERARRSEDRESVVGAMVHGRDENAEGLTDRELIDNLKLLVLAGHETTASVVAWAMLRLAEEPAMWRRLCEEASAHGRIPTTPDELGEVPFAVGCFREALRLYPPVANTIRTTNRAFELGGYHLPANIYVACNLHEVSRNPERYPDPDAFVPERWTGRSGRPSQIELCQFGGGPHFCLGYHVAMLEGAAFLTGTALALERRGWGISTTGARPRPIYLPVVHPPRRSTIVIG